MRGRHGAAIGADRLLRDLDGSARTWRQRLGSRRRVYAGRLRRGSARRARAAPGAASLVGASLGGLTALLAEGSRAAALRRAGPRRYRAPHRGRRRRHVSSSSCAARRRASRRSRRPPTRSPSYLPHRRRPRDLSGLAKNLRLLPNGRLRWHWDPAFLEPGYGPRPRRRTAGGCAAPRSACAADAAGARRRLRPALGGRRARVPGAGSPRPLRRRLRRRPHGGGRPQRPLHGGGPQLPPRHPRGRLSSA